MRTCHPLATVAALVALSCMPTWAAELQCPLPGSGESAIEDFCPPTEGMARFKIRGAWGFVDLAGKLAVPPQFDEVMPFSQGLAAVKKGELWGYIDKTGRWVVQPKFSDASSFAAGLAAAELDGKWGYIDKTGQWQIAPAYERAGAFTGERAIVSEGYGRDLMINLQGAVIKRFGPNVQADRGTLDGMFMAEQKTPPVLQHADGRRLPMPEGAAFARHYREGLLLASKPNPQGGSGDLLWGAVDLQGQWVIAPTFTELQDFEDGLAVATVKADAGAAGGTDARRVGLVDKRGQWVAPAQYVQIQRDAGGIYRAWRTQGGAPDILNARGQRLFTPACAELNELSMSLWHAPQWTVLQGCGQTWAIHARAGLLKTTVKNPEASATAEHLLLLDDDKPAEGSTAPRRFEIFNSAGERVLSSDAPQLQGEHTLRWPYDTVALLPNAAGLTPQAAKLLPLAVITRGYERQSLITRSLAVVHNPQWRYESDRSNSLYPSKEQPLEGPWPMKTDAGWGAVDGQGQWVIQPGLRRLSTFRQGVAFAEDGSGEWMLDATGRRHAFPKDGRQFRRVAPLVVLGEDSEGNSVRLDLKTGQQQRAQAMAGVRRGGDFEGGLAPAEKGDLWGLINGQGQWALAPKFTSSPSAVKEDATLMGWKTGLYFKTARGTETLQGWVNPQGQEVVAPRHSEIRFDKTASALMVATEGVGKGVVGLDGKVLVEDLYQEVTALGEGWFSLQAPDSHGLLKADGEWAYPPLPVYMESFSDTRVKVLQRANQKVLFDIAQGRFSTRDKPLTMPQDTPQTWWPEVQDAYGEQETSVFYGFDFQERLRLPGSVGEYDRFSEDTISFKPRKAGGARQVGLADTKGKVLGLYPYAKIEPMRNGYAVFSQETEPMAKPGTKAGKRPAAEQEPKLRQGYLQRDGKVAIAARFEGAGDFVQERAVVVLGGNLGLIDTRGQLLMHSGWLCGRDPVLLGPAKQVLWPDPARQKKKC